MIEPTQEKQSNTGIIIMLCVHGLLILTLLIAGAILSAKYC